MICSLHTITQNLLRQLDEIGINNPDEHVSGADLVALMLEYRTALMKAHEPVPGKRRINIEIDDELDITTFATDGFYELDLGFSKVVVSGHTFNGMSRVYWDMTNQKWDQV